MAIIREEAVVYIELRRKLLERVAGWPSDGSLEQAYELVRQHAVDVNYYNWFVRYVQQAAFALQTDLAQVQFRIKLHGEDELEFVLSNATQESHFTGRVVGHQIVLAYNQKPDVRGLSDANAP